MLLLREPSEELSEILSNLVRVYLAEVVAELVAPRELLLADGAAEGRLDHVLHRLELAAALPRVHHHLNLQQARCHLHITIITIVSNHQCLQIV